MCLTPAGVPAQGDAIGVAGYAGAATVFATGAGAAATGAALGVAAGVAVGVAVGFGADVTVSAEASRIPALHPTSTTRSAVAPAIATARRKLAIRSIGRPHTQSNLLADHNLRCPGRAAPHPPSLFVRLASRAPCSHPRGTISQPPSAASTMALASCCTCARFSGPRKDSA